MEKNYAKKQKGITLVALVVTIVILLILSGISLNIVLGNNGIITKAQEAKIANNHSTVYEAMQLQYDNYYTESTTGENDADFITDLKNKSILDENMDVNVKTLVGKKLSTGNGSNLKDVYVVEQDETDGSYRLKYYGNNESEDKDLGIIGYEKEGADEPSDPSIFEFEPENGDITLKGTISGYYTQKESESNENVTHLKKIVVPRTIDGVKVTNIGNVGTYMGFSSAYVEEIVLPNSVEIIRADAFASCINLKTINIPNSVKKIEERAFWNCRSLESIYIPSNVIKIYKPFVGCIKLQTINVDEKNTAYTSENGVLMNKNKTTIVAYPSGKKDSSYTIGKNINKIEDDFDCENLQAFNVEEENANYSAEDGVLFNKDKTIIIRCPAGKTDTYTINSSIIGIKDKSFSGCNNVHITVAAGSSLNENSFRDSGLSDSQIAEITFEN